MCIEVSYRYHCGHDHVEYYQHCPLNMAANAVVPSEKCNIHDRRIERQNSLCPLKACQRLERSWGCCQCKQGPNISTTCEQSPSSPAQKCGHELCPHCPGWDCFKKLQELNKVRMGSIKEEEEKWRRRWLCWGKYERVSDWGRVHIWLEYMNYWINLSYRLSTIFRPWTYFSDCNIRLISEGVAKERHVSCISVTLNIYTPVLASSQRRG